MKRISLIFLLSSLAFGQGVILPPQQALKVVNGITSPVANATITVCAANTSGIPCSPVLASALFKDAALTQPLTNPFTSDANGNYVFAIAPGNYTVTVSAATFVGYSYQTTAPMASGANNTFSGNNSFGGTNSFTGSNTFSGNLTATAGTNNLTAAVVSTTDVWVGNGITQFSGSDVFAQANTAAGTLPNGGTVHFVNGSYSVSTTLSCVNNIGFDGNYSKITYTGSTKAINCQSSGGNDLHDAKILRMTVLGSKTASTFGLWVGNGTANTGLTRNNHFEDLNIGTCALGSSVNGFDNGIVVDGNTNSGTYDNVFVNVCSSANLHQGWQLVPTLNNHANANTCMMCRAFLNGGDGIRIDGANDWAFMGFDTEDQTTAGTYGINFAGTQATQNDIFYGGDNENNLGADINCGSLANVFYNHVRGMNLADTTKFAGNCTGLGNEFYSNTPGGNIVSLGILNAACNGNFCYKIGSQEGTAHVMFGIATTGVDAGNMTVGSGQYPIAASLYSDGSCAGPSWAYAADQTTGWARQGSGAMSYCAAGNEKIRFTAGGLTSTGTGATLTGTGACASRTGQLGGAFAGQIQCTGATGASTLTITPGTTAPNGWSCYGSDATTTLSGSMSGAISTTACTLSFTTVTANDLIRFGTLSF